ncbi:hypothetical protein [Bradyrhizobium yuanmingense]|uniref:hypothetical protein n=1 Tax=Bradyrhizobium yuanmingense TaxID=108015 RepID=UPI0023B8CE62|nr:hypothetical protein [Bradyrhizobium yuanmingense]MDF0499021.1 hypothetical protein [Bradyrhizobium yuanmingense]
MTGLVELGFGARSRGGLHGLGPVALEAELRGAHHIYQRLPPFAVESLRMAANSLSRRSRSWGLSLESSVRQAQAGVLGIERLGRFAKQPGDVDVIDFGKPGELASR